MTQTESAGGFDPNNPDLFKEPPGWPKVVGTISIVWGSLGVLCMVCMGAMSTFGMSMAKQAESQMGGPMPDVMKPGPAQYASMAIGVVWGVLLLTAGIMLVARKEPGRLLHLVYGVGGVLLGLVTTGIGVAQQLRIQSWVAANPDSGWAKQSGGPFAWVMLGFFTILGFAWPVFCTIWFGAVKRKAPLT